MPGGHGFLPTFRNLLLSARYMVNLLEVCSLWFSRRNISVSGLCVIIRRIGPARTSLQLSRLCNKTRPKGSPCSADGHGSIFDDGRSTCQSRMKRMSFPGHGRFTPNSRKNLFLFAGVPVEGKVVTSSLTLEGRLGRWNSVSAGSNKSSIDAFLRVDLETIPKEPVHPRLCVEFITIGFCSL